jgi:DNA replication and repair protein RecF
LKSLAGRGGAVHPEDISTLDTWSEQLAGFGSELMAARADTLGDLGPFVAKSYSAIAPVNNLAGVEYKPRVAVDLGINSETRATQMYSALLEAMNDRRADELRRGLSLVGPHRDEVELSIGQLPAKGYASHGESWSLALALRLGSFALLEAEDINPVLILDDVFAELDATRRHRLLDAVTGNEDHRGAEQIFITAAVAEDVPKDLPATWFRVDHGTVESLG